MNRSFYFHTNKHNDTYTVHQTYSCDILSLVRCSLLRAHLLPTHSLTILTKFQTQGLQTYICVIQSSGRQSVSARFLVARLPRSASWTSPLLPRVSVALNTAGITRFLTQHRGPLLALGLVILDFHFRHCRASLFVLSARTFHSLWNYHPEELQSFQREEVESTINVCEFSNGCTTSLNTCTYCVIDVSNGGTIQVEPDCGFLFAGEAPSLLLR